MVPYRKVEPGDDEREGEGRDGEGSGRGGSERGGTGRGERGRRREEGGKVINIMSLSRSRVTSTNQFGMRAFSGPRNIVPTLVACSRDE